MLERDQVNPVAGAADDNCALSVGAALEAIGPGDTTGTDTLARYMYQCKVAVQRWLATLELSEDARILCEFVDDITTATSTEVVFAQVKTRDRGSWTAAKVLAKGGGLDSLARSYNLAKAAGAISLVRLELLLEGPEGPANDTRSFFATPTSATNAQRTSLKKLGVAAKNVDDFLARLRITPQYHARQSIDAVTIKLLMALVPAHSSELESLYDKLLASVVAAHLGACASADPEHPLVLPRVSHCDLRDL